MSFFFSSRRRHTRFKCDWSSDVCSSDLPNTDKAGAQQVAERLRARIEGLALEHRISRFGHVTASIGVATAQGDEAGATQGATQGTTQGSTQGAAVALVEAADRALYRAKAAGRNCVQG